MYSIGGYSSSTTNRVTGLSGFDTESVVKSLMEAESLPLTQMQQRRQILAWKQESYRDVTTQLRGFKSTFFDLLNPSKNLLSNSNIRKLAAQSSSSANVRVTANAGAASGSHDVRVTQLATAAVARSTASVTADLSGTVSELNMAGKSLRMTLNGDTRTINLADYSGGNLETALQAEIDKVFGTGKVQVTYPGGATAGGTLTMKTINGAGALTLSAPVAPAVSGLADMGFAAGATNRISTGSTLASLSGKLGTAISYVDNKVSFSVNGKAFSFNDTDTLKTVMDAVNADGTAGVTMRYDEATDQLQVRAKQTGAGQTIALQESGSSFFAAFGINVADPVLAGDVGKDAMATINGQAVVRSSNTFTLNDISYTLVKEHAVGEADATVSVERDITGTVDLIKEFVGKYNEVLDLLNNKSSEKYDRAYLPLTDAQRKAMSEDQVKQWEDRAKTGLLQNDSMLQGLAQKLRQALTDAVSGAGLTLRDIGIASASYSERGRLTIDETKLKTAIESKGEQVAALLNGQPDTISPYSRTLTATEKTGRYAVVGLFHRVSDILEDHVSILRDTNGKKGFLLEKAGITGDSSMGLNDIQRELTGFDSRISTMLERLADKEEAYYRRFTAMEQALQRMNEQSSWLASQLGGA